MQQLTNKATGSHTAQSWPLLSFLPNGPGLDAESRQQETAWPESDRKHKGNVDGIFVLTQSSRTRALAENKSELGSWIFS